MKRVILLLIAAALAGPVPVSAAPPCEGPPAAFVGVVYDAAMRADFRADVDTFHRYSQVLQESYCVPQERVEILAFANQYVSSGTLHAEGSEANLKQAIRDLEPLVEAEPDMTVFVLLSSHGIFHRSPGACGGSATTVGSLAALRAGQGEDGSLYDCELGAVLNESLPVGTKAVVMVDCSFCGGFSDSITAASGTIRDDALTSPSGVPAPGRIVITGCAITTECFGSDGGGVLYKYLARVLDGGVAACDGFTVPGFPAFGGVNLPARLATPDGTCSMTEWFFAAVDAAYRSRDAIAIQQQFRIKYGLDSLADDITVL